MYITADGGAQAIGSVGSGICTAEGNGYYTYAPSQAETNADLIAFTFIGTGSIPVTVQVPTEALLSAIAAGVAAILVILNGITSLASWLRRLIRKDAGDAAMGVAEGEIMLGGAATVDFETDSMEGIRDAIPTTAAIADQVWDELLATHSTAGSAGAQLGANPTVNEVALAILLLDWETIVDTVPPRSVLNALQHIRNKWKIIGSTKTVMKEDDVTAAYTTTITADAEGRVDGAVHR